MPFPDSLYLTIAVHFEVNPNEVPKQNPGQQFLHTDLLKYSQLLYLNLLLYMQN